MGGLLKFESLRVLLRNNLFLLSSCKFRIAGLEGTGRRSGEVARRSVGKIRKVVMDRRFSKNRVPIFSIALRQRSSARSQTVWKAKASRFRDTNTAERLFFPWPKLCSRSLFFRTLKLSFSIF